MVIQMKSINVKTFVVFLILNTFFSTGAIAKDINSEQDLQYSYEIGNVVFSDGKATSIDVFINNTNDYLKINGKPIGIIAYKGDDGFAKKEKTYVLGLKQGFDLEWIKFRKKRRFLALVSSPSSTGYYAANTAHFSGGVSDGYNILSGCIAMAESMTTYTKKGLEVDMEKCKEKFPAFYFSENYSKLGDINTKKTKFDKDWFIPTLHELCMIYKNRQKLNDSLSKLPSSHQLFSKYWTVSQYYDGTPWVVDFDNASIDYELEEYDFPKVIVVHYLE